MIANKTVTVFSNHMALKVYMKLFLLLVLFATYIITPKKWQLSSLQLCMCYE